MNMFAVDRTIRALCADVESSTQVILAWYLRTEEELLHEACVCMFSSQMVFEVAEAAARQIKVRGLLNVITSQDYEKKIAAALSEPLRIEREGIVRYVRPRFKNRLARLLSTTVRTMRAQGKTLRDTLLSASSSREARETLVQQVWGFGPKQASLFLRRVGYCTELAVLDTHIMDYLRAARGLDSKPGALSRLESYERIEIEFQKVAEEFGHSVGCVDMAMWITVRVAKREAVW